MNDPGASPMFSHWGWRAGALGWALLAFSYYQQFFGGAASLGLAVYLTLLVAAMVYAGTMLALPGQAFPTRRFLLVTAAFGLLRWGVVFVVLRHHLPPETIFHYAGRSLWFLLPSTAVVLFCGYGLALHRRSHHPDPPAAAPPIPGVTVLHFRAEGQDVLLPVDELLAVSARGEYVIYRCADRQYARFQRLKEAQAELASHGFLRVHRSHVVALGAIRSATAQSVTLTDGSVVPVSASYRSAVGDRLAGRATD